MANAHSTREKIRRKAIADYLVSVERLIVAVRTAARCTENVELAEDLTEAADWMESRHVVLLEALKHALPILIGAIAIVDCRAVVAEVRAAIKQAERT